MDFTGFSAESLRTCYSFYSNPLPPPSAPCRSTAQRHFPRGAPPLPEIPKMLCNLSAQPTGLCTLNKDVYWLMKESEALECSAFCVHRAPPHLPHSPCSPCPPCTVRVPGLLFTVQRAPERPDSHAVLLLQAQGSLPPPVCMPGTQGHPGTWNLKRGIREQAEH